MPTDALALPAIPPATRLWRWRGSGGRESLFFATPEEIQTVLIGQVRFGNRVHWAEFTEIDLTSVSRTLSGADLFRT